MKNKYGVPTKNHGIGNITDWHVEVLTLTDVQKRPNGRIIISRSSISKILLAMLENENNNDLVEKYKDLLPELLGYD